MPRRTASTYQLKVMLKGTQPPVWRRLLLASDLDLVGLHQAIQIAMGWENAHMHQFMHDGRFYGTPEVEVGLFEVQDEASFRIADLLRSERDWLTYVYDFGDDWEHRITLEKVLPAEDRAPVCIKARGACPPEDIGGVFAYRRLLDALAEPGNPRAPELAGLTGLIHAGFDPHAVDILDINEMLHAHWTPRTADAA